ncbi:GDSL-type esterase/lipase family protein [Thermomonospora cellulosilytica]|uniref:Lysophospholipase L1-like esterase n=1 Tax=Thermomonospora cellulosilytica TaxID=1411118 RepID=A0A7W3MYX9_9ACTN|nr:GDSL-type esterase/lipase family protein [Thermomonospora cellulosilytica]MBA9004445.1 lysophospholipase L1-like esterase [Thermomonospora cellulosilytica]
MLRPVVPLTLATALTGLAGLTGAVLAAPGAAAEAAEAPVPTRMVALGDSITRGFNACGWYVDCIGRSWSTGHDTAVRSHYLRLAAREPSLTPYNAAATGARVADLARQAQIAVDRRAQYVTILIGANDACAPTEERMTPVADFETRFRVGLRTLREGLPGAEVFVASIPDLRRLWQVGRGNAVARTAWARFGICQSMLARPLSASAADIARRERVRQRVIDYNAVLRRLCAQDARCRFDDDAVFDYRFTLAQVSKWDYFHPNGNGQAVLARVTYARSFWPAAVWASAR